MSIPSLVEITVDECAFVIRIFADYISAVGDGDGLEQEQLDAMNSLTTKMQDRLTNLLLAGTHTSYPGMELPVPGKIYYRCKQCFARWVKHDDGTWSLVPGQLCGPCCDNPAAWTFLKNLEKEDGVL